MTHSKRFDAQEQVLALGASRGDVLELRHDLSPCDDRRRGHCQVRSR